MALAIFTKNPLKNIRTHSLPVGQNVILIHFKINIACVFIIIGCQSTILNKLDVLLTPLTSLMFVLLQLFRKKHPLFCLFFPKFHQMHAKKGIFHLKKPV